MFNAPTASSSGAKFAGYEGNVALAAARTNKTGMYCWYHGNCDHSGADCDLKDQVKGFQSKASKKNPIGGAEGDWVDVKKAILAAGNKVIVSAKRSQEKKST